MLILYKQTFGNPECICIYLHISSYCTKYAKHVFSVKLSLLQETAVVSVNQ